MIQITNGLGLLFFLAAAFFPAASPAAPPRMNKACQALLDEFHEKIIIQILIPPKSSKFCATTAESNLATTVTYAQSCKDTLLSAKEFWRPLFKVCITPADRKARGTG